MQEHNVTIIKNRSTVSLKEKKEKKSLTFPLFIPGGLWKHVTLQQDLKFCAPTGSIKTAINYKGHLAVLCLKQEDSKDS